MNNPCPGCGGLFPVTKGPVHRYMESSPGCWETFGRVLEREYSDIQYYRVHRISVDTYAVQHPGQPSRQTIQSVGLHLLRLSCFLEDGLTQEQANSVMTQAARFKQTFTWLSPPEPPYQITVFDVVNAENADDHYSIVNQWAASTWNSWSHHHEVIRHWKQLTREN